MCSLFIRLKPVSTSVWLLDEDQVSAGKSSRRITIFCALKLTFSENHHGRDHSSKQSSTTHGNLQHWQFHNIPGLPPKTSPMSFKDDARDPMCHKQQAASGHKQAAMEQSAM